MDIQVPSTSLHLDSYRRWRGRAALPEKREETLAAFVWGEEENDVAVKR
jgi:hypothetical protein